MGLSAQQGEAPSFPESVKMGGQFYVFHGNCDINAFITDANNNDFSFAHNKYKVHITPALVGGSLGYFMTDKNGQLYGLSAGHVFNNSEKPCGKLHIPHVHSLSKISKNFTNNVLHLGSDAMLFYGNAEINVGDEPEDVFVDVSLFPILQTTKESGHFNTYTKNIKLNICENLDNDTRQMHHVQKIGATTGFTHGDMIDCEFVYNPHMEGEDVRCGMFIVKESSMGNKVKFADLGDSGSLVTDILTERKGVPNNEANAYGIVHAIHNNYRDDEGTVHPHVTFCVNLDYSIQVLNDKFSNIFSLHHDTASTKNIPIPQPLASNDFQSNCGDDEEDCEIHPGNNKFLSSEAEQDVKNGKPVQPLPLSNPEDNPVELQYATNNINDSQNKHKSSLDKPVENKQTMLNFVTEPTSTRNNEQAPNQHINEIIMKQDIDPTEGTQACGIAEQQFFRRILVLTDPREEPQEESCLELDKDDPIPRHRSLPVCLQKKSDTRDIEHFSLNKSSITSKE